MGINPPTNCQSHTFIEKWRVCAVRIMWWNYCCILAVLDFNSTSIRVFVPFMKNVVYDFWIRSQFGAMGFSSIVFKSYTFIRLQAETQNTVAGSHSNSNNTLVVLGFNRNGPATPKKRRRLERTNKKCAGLMMGIPFYLETINNWTK